MNLIAFHHRKELNKSTIIAGIIIVIFLFFSYFFQMWGIQYTSASNAGFITGVNVVLVPIFTVLIFKDKPQISSLIGVILVFTGLFLLSGDSLSEFNIGDLMVFICAIAVAFQVIFTGKFAPKHNIYLLTTVQLFINAILSIIFAFYSSVPAGRINFQYVCCSYLSCSVWNGIYIFNANSYATIYHSNKDSAGICHGTCFCSIVCLPHSRTNINNHGLGRGAINFSRNDCS
jgi:drug/metabolite transporter (DMT)-like permease